jgi:beta-galactosidase
MNHIIRLKIFFMVMILCDCACSSLHAQRRESVISEGWKFAQSERTGAEKPNYNDAKWQMVSVPHDWAIYGPFSREYDLQKVAVTQNFETKASVKTGRTGGLPYVGIGWYRRKLDISSFDSDKQRATLLFDGAMSEAQVYINGKKACFWPYGYNSFFCDITSLVNKDGQNNVIAVRLENRPQSSRWYSGAGLYRNVHLIVTNDMHIPVWGTYITTPHVEKAFATIRLQTTIENVVKGKKLKLETRIYDAAGKEVASKTTTECNPDGQPNTQNFIVDNPQLWSPETPSLYEARTTLYIDNTPCDIYTTRFGIRSVEVVAERGFFLNGENRKFQGVCLHHDLGPLGAAVNRSAIRHQLTMLKEMGCDAVRTSHNMPAPELVELCDSMGLMVMIEPFDEWDMAKCTNGYHRYFNEWAERDMVNMLHNYRNHPSVVMWSVGNEVPTQCNAQGYKVASFLQSICHREDPTRPVTCGMDQVDCVLSNGFAAQLDVPGFNYRVKRYNEAYDKLPQGVVLGSETSSTVSSRGIYKFPAALKADAKYNDHQCSSYDTEYCSWSNIPDDDLAMAEDHQWAMGQFVWTGFDYLGEPSPYDTDAWPNHSSMFGIIDLASIPKDRYYLYRSVWNKRNATLHILPHWTWTGREGQATPIFVYTSYPEAELFVNGISQGRKKKDNTSRLGRYRLCWDEVTYQPGELKVVAYNANGEKADEKIVKTAGKPHHLEVSVNTDQLKADGEDLCYITIRAVDKDGNLCPNDNRLVNFKVSGAGTFKATANGDACSLDLFHLPQMHLFSGQCTAIIQSKKTPGTIKFSTSAKGLKSISHNIQVR